MIAAITLHELAHVVAGMAVGYRTAGVRAAGLSISRSGTGWKVQFAPAALFGGCYKPIVPPDKLDHNRAACMVGAAPVVSILLAAVMTWAVVTFGDGAAQWRASAFWAAALLACLSLIPSRSGFNRSDISRLWQLYSDPERARSWISLLAILSEDAIGVRPREWTQDLCELAFRNDAVPAENAYRNLLGYYRAMDLGCTESALNRLESALSVPSSTAIRAGAFGEAAFASAVFLHNVPQARIWLQRTRAIAKSLPMHSVEAGIAWGEGKSDDALRHFAEADQYLQRKCVDSGLARFARAKYAEYSAAIRNGQDEEGMKEKFTEPDREGVD